MQTIDNHIAGAEQVFSRVRLEHENSRSELIDLTDIVEVEPYKTLRTKLRDIDQLAAKIKVRGQLVPILVWLRRGEYVLLSGHRRVNALRTLGAKAVKAIVYGDRQITAKDALDIAIDDNVDRNNFSKVELAALVAKLVANGMTQRDIGKRLRLSTGSVSDHFRLHGAPADIKEAVDDGRIALRAGLRLSKAEPVARAAVIASSTKGLLSLGDIERALASDAPEPAEPEPVAEPVRAAGSAPIATAPARAKRGAAWSRQSALIRGVAWERTRGTDREVRIRLGQNPTPDQRLALKKLLLDLAWQLDKTRAP